MSPASSKPSPENTLFVGGGETATLMRKLDWSGTVAGEVDTWPHSVRAILRMMLTSRYAMWMGWGPQLAFLYNDAYARMTLGAKHPWALGRPASEVWAEIWSDIGPRIDHVLTTGQATWDEGLLLFLERSGFPEETYHTFSYSPLHQDDGTIVGMFCVVTEETDRIIDERRLNLLRVLGERLTASQTVEQVWAALEAALASDARDFPFALAYMLDADQSNLQLAATSNVAPGDPVARATLDGRDRQWPIDDLIDGEAAQVKIELDAGTVWPRGPWQKAPGRAVAVAIARQGQSRPAAILIAGLNPFRPFDDAYSSFVSLIAGQLAAALANVMAHAAERQRAQALAQIDRAKTTFFSNVSHELRTPLTLMLAPVTESLETAERTLSGDTLALVHRNGLRLHKLVNALLDFSRIEAGRMEASYEPVDLGAYTADVASSFRSTIERAGLRYRVETATSDPPTYVDREMWEKIVLNLISNAFKFTLEGEIAVTVAREGERMVLAVRDSGIGIPATELPRIFERFHRVDGARGRTLEGTGIGLALVQELVRLHGGTISVESEAGRGTTFRVAIPVGAAHLPSARIVEPRALETTTLGAQPFMVEANRWLPEDAAAGTLLDRREETAGDTLAARIVLADDNADMRAYLAQLLGRRWQVASASNGLEALALARATAPDLVVSDVMMPGLDGFGLLRELRSDPQTRHIPVMLLSARAGEEARIEGFEAGADDYLVKPFTAREALARVEAQLLRARMRSVADEHRRRLGAVFASAPVAIAVLRGSDHVYEMVNESYRALIDQREVLGRPIREALPELEGQAICDVLDAVYQSGERFVGRSYPIDIRRGPAGALEQTFFDFVYQPTTDAAGRVDGIVAVGFEVTELANARQAAEDANRAKDEFLAMLGHELRNPLAPILTALQLLRLRGVQAGDRERTIIERQVRHLVSLVDDLLDVSRITRGKVRLNRLPIELSESVAKGIELASPLLEQQRHTLSVDVATTGLGVLADTDRLAQVVSNLLTNAAKYTPPEGRVSVSASVEGDDVVLRVRDTGIGIAPEMLPRIFELFAQDRQAIDRAPGGLGLGLAIVRSLVKLHGGSVSAHSDGRDRGSEFVVHLPRVIADRAGAAEPAPEPRATGLRLLVVDDNRDAAMMLAEALALAGHQTEVAHDGPEALAKAARFHPDVALVDIGLPVMDGFELAHQLRSRYDARQLALVAVTGYGQEHDRRRSREAGFAAHLVKPVDLDELKTLIGQLREEAGRRDPANER